ncbi:DUF3923 family protein [Liquorilactobacillus capillatus]|uniref:DUF3923 family protein n=1 Tax=Liquorilactobacillus capillatus TaxID=480931 RepID=UPI00070ABE63|nr:DUF3923 family protein [Liquorilactobacillus capillatus]
MKLWSLANIFWLIVFVAMEIFILLRKVDGAGTVQDSTSRFVSSVVLLVFFVIIAVVQFVIRLLLRKRG